MADDMEVERMPHPDPAGLDTEALIALLNNHDPVDGEIARRLRQALAEAAVLREALEAADRYIEHRGDVGRLAAPPWTDVGPKGYTDAESHRDLHRIDAALSTPSSAALAALEARIRDEVKKEAASVAQKRADLPAENDYEQGWRRAAEVIAADIRAMKGQGDG